MSDREMIESPYDNCTITLPEWPSHSFPVIVSAPNIEEFEKGCLPHLSDKQ